MTDSTDFEFVRIVTQVNPETGEYKGPPFIAFSSVRPPKWDGTLVPGPTGFLFRPATFAYFSSSDLIKIATRIKHLNAKATKERLEKKA